MLKIGDKVYFSNHIKYTKIYKVLDICYEDNSIIVEIIKSPRVTEVGYAQNFLIKYPSFRGGGEFLKLPDFIGKPHPLTKIFK